VIELKAENVIEAEVVEVRRDDGTTQAAEDANAAGLESG
jgi:hypothetical protein